MNNVGALINQAIYKINKIIMNKKLIDKYKRRWIN